ncbi:MAG: zf-HC2 domain-containing protein [Gemmatimonadetes bacterium]|nr:zf-HC2 domain-containing protein [Gemmatimonadota bacterium]
MWHVDDGQLHAYLDGELGSLGQDQAGRFERHLSECDECRARLEHARTVREGARTILQGSGPAQLAPPPFETLAARARRATPRHRLISRLRPSSVAWAASLILALGAGWMARQLVLPMERAASRSEAPRGVELDAASSGDVAPPAEPREAGAAEAAVPAGPLAARAVTRPAGTAERRAPAASTARGRRAGSSPVIRGVDGRRELALGEGEAAPAAPPAPPPPAVPPPAGGAELAALPPAQAVNVVAPPELEEAVPESRAGAPVEAAAAAAAPPPVDSRFLDEQSRWRAGEERRDREVAEAYRRAAGQTLPRAGARAEAGGVAAKPADPAAPPVPAGAPAGPWAGLAARVAGRPVPLAEWQSVDAATANRWLGGAVARVPDFSTVATQVTLLDGRPAVRTIQLSQTGNTLELVQLRDTEAVGAGMAGGNRAAAAEEQEKARAREVEAPRAAAPGALVMTPAWNALLAPVDGAAPDLVTLTLRRDGYLIIARAVLPADSLRALLARIR